MRNLKRVLSLALALVMVLGMMVITTSAADFTDAEEITYTEAVEVMSALGILKGYEDGSFKPKGTLNRQEAAKILAFVCLGDEADNYLTGSTKSFDDVAADHWAAKYIAYCKNLGIVNGVNDEQTLFNPTGTLTTAQFAKMLLVAIGIDGTYTGAGWEDAVKNAVADVNELDATGIKIDNSDITREEACELALAAMKYSPVAAGWDVKLDGVKLKNFTDYAEALVYKATMDALLTEGTLTVEPVDATGSLLVENYGVTYGVPYDDFGRPGIRYENEEAELDLFFADKALATFEGPVAEKDIYAASGKKTDDYVSYTIIEDGDASKHTGTTFYACKAEKSKDDTNDAEWFAAGTGYGIKSELYKDAAGNYTLISIREYLGTVAVNEIDEEVENDKRTVTVTLADETVLAEYETEAFEDDDVVIVTIAGDEVQTIALAQTVTGIATKITSGSGSVDNKTYTIGGDAYVVSQTTFEEPGVSSVEVELGEEMSWYVDSFGNLIGNVDPAGPSDPVYYYAYLVDYAAQKYAKATADDLLGEGGTDEKAAKELFQVIDANGDEVILNGAVKVEKNGQTYTTDFVADAWATAELDQSAENDIAEVLIRYELDKDGNVSSVTKANITPNDAVTVQKGKATMSGSSLLLTDKTVFFFIDGEEEITAYVGYKNIPGTTTAINAACYYTAETLVMDAVLLTSATVQGAAPETNYVYFAGTGYTTEWNAAANNGQGASFVLYENIYVNGVKAETGLKFATTQSVAAGTLYTYTTDATTGLSTITGTVIAADEVGTKATMVQDTYFKAGTVKYTDEETVFWQVDQTAKTITVVEGIPASTQTKDTIVLKVVDGEDAAALVIFTTRNPS